MPDVAVGVDLGGTNIRFGLVDKAGKILLRKRLKTRADEGVKEVITRLVAAIRAVMDKAGEMGHKVVGIGLGVPGIISADEGIVRLSPNLPGWMDVPLREELAATLKVPVYVENDANAYALGEAWFGAGRDAKSMVCLTLGTGVGGGIILGGRIWRGIDGMAGEVGHITVEPGGPLCPCGNFGCLERYSSATAVVEMFSRAMGKNKKSSLSASFRKDPASVSAQTIADAAKKGDRLSRQIYTDAGRHLGIAVADLINLLNVEMVIIGGGMSAAWDLFIDSLREEVFSRAFDIPAGHCRIVRARLRDDAGILGAAGLAFQVA